MSVLFQINRTFRLSDQWRERVHPARRFCQPGVPVPL